MLKRYWVVLVVGFILCGAYAGDSNAQVATSEEILKLKTDDVLVKNAAVQYVKNYDMLDFEIEVSGKVGKTTPQARGGMNGAPVLGYVFPTTLKPQDVGFSATEGIVALAITSHPDFDDTMLWDENNDGKYDNDGVVYHTHWVVLVKDSRVKGGLSVKEFKKEDKSVILPPTNCGMPMYMDAPGYSVLLDKNKLHVLVPTQRVNNNKQFKFDAVSAYMEVNTEDMDRPMLGVYEVFSVLSGDLSLPYQVK